MKVKVIKAFRDKHTGELHSPNSKKNVLNISKERYEEILKVGKFVEKIEEGKAVKPPKDKAAE